jgi:hypothetical protein
MVNQPLRRMRRQTKALSPVIALPTIRFCIW